MNVRIRWKANNPGFLDPDHDELLAVVKKVMPIWVPLENIVLED